MVVALARGHILQEVYACWSARRGAALRAPWWAEEADACPGVRQAGLQAGWQQPGVRWLLQPVVACRPPAESCSRAQALLCRQQQLRVGRRAHPPKKVLVPLGTLAASARHVPSLPQLSPAVPKGGTVVAMVWRHHNLRSGAALLDHLLELSSK